MPLLISHADLNVAGGLVDWRGGGRLEGANPIRCQTAGTSAPHLGRRSTRPQMPICQTAARVGSGLTMGINASVISLVRIIILFF